MPVWDGFAWGCWAAGCWCCSAGGRTRASRKHGSVWIFPGWKPLPPDSPFGSACPELRSGQCPAAGHDPGRGAGRDCHYRGSGGAVFRRTDPMFSLLEKLCRIAPVYYVSGNHEYGRRDREEIFARAAQAGAVVLRHVMRRDTIGGQGFGFWGWTRWAIIGEPQALEEFSQKEGFKLLLSHFTERFAGEYRV